MSTDQALDEAATAPAACTHSEPPPETQDAPETPELPETPETPETPLRRNRRYRALWVGGAGASLATMTLDVAIPVLVLAVTGSAAAAGAYGFIEAAASVAAGIPGGSFLDRHNRRTLLIAADGVRALSFGFAALILLLGHLALPYLLAVAAVSGAARSLSGAARILATRAVVPPSQLTRALAQEQARNQTASIIGPAAAGLLYAASRALPLLGAALGYLLAALAALAAPDDRSASLARRDEPGGRGTGEVFKILLRNPMLRACLVACALINIGGGAVTLTVVVLIRSHGGSASAVGFAFALTSVGGLLGTLLVKPLHALLRPGWLLIALCAWVCVTCAALVLPFGPWWYGVAMALGATVTPALIVLLDVLILRQVADALRGRAVAVIMVFLNAGLSLGPLAAGLTLQFLGASTAVVVFALVFGAAALYAASKGSVRAATWPAAQ